MLGGAWRGRPDDAQACARVVRRHARTFALASCLLPARQRRGTFALYAFCRTADDIVDAPVDGPAEDVQAGRVAALQALERDMCLALQGRPPTPLLRELARTVDEFEVPVPALVELLRGVEQDLVTTHYQSWHQLARYCEGVASSVGELCVHVFGVVGGSEVRAQAVQSARTLGVALQLTNILRDVGEDAGRGRVYVPIDDLADHGLAVDDVLKGRITGEEPEWRALMSMYVARARDLYEAALPGIALLSPASRRAAAACAHGYSRILNAIERRNYDTLNGRAVPTRLDRAMAMYDAVRLFGVMPRECTPFVAARST
jgi:phytoene synthase